MNRKLINLVVRVTNLNISKILALFVSKFGLIIVGLIFLPNYNKISTAEVFGVITAILTMQSLSLLLDLGIAQNAGRLISKGGEDFEKDLNIIIWNMRRSLKLIYILVGIFFFIYSISTEIMNLEEAAICSLTFYFIAKQNAIISCILGIKKYYAAALFQLTGNIGRHILSFALMTYIYPGIIEFVIGQLAFSLVQEVSFNLYFNRKFPRINFSENQKIKLTSTWISISAIFGAIAIQSDKLIIGKFSGVEALGPYYLAGTIGYIPLFILAMPIVQYYQPIIYDLISRNEKILAIKKIKEFIVILSLAAVIPGLLAIYFSSDIINFWLGDGGNNQIVSSYTRILLFGTSIGIYGYVPHIILSALTDFKYMAILSTLSSLILILFIFIFSIENNLIYVCYASSLYHIIVAIFLWIRVNIKFKSIIFQK
jgi:O-antigen/teichoic acid export membrane protein